MLHPTPGTLQYSTLIANIEQGIIKIPQFQRKFVWSVEQTAKLLDSILKGYPIGTFILWQTDERLAPSATSAASHCLIPRQAILSSMCWTASSV